MFYSTRLSPSTALLAMTLFFANGGLGFWFFVRDVLEAPSWDLLLFPPREYTYLPDHGIQWFNIVASELLPQRALLLGMAATLAVLIPLARWGRPRLDGTPAWKLVLLGLAASLLLVVHVHSYLSLVILCGVLLLFDLRSYRSWLWFGVSAAVPSMVLFSLLYGEAGGRSFLAWHPGWLANPADGHGMSVWIFLLINWGVSLPLAAFGIARFRYDRDPLVLGGVVLFVLSFLLKFQPYTWDNMKILTWAYLLLTIPAARVLAHLWRRGGATWRLSAALLLALATASGSLELWRLTRADELTVRMWSRAEIDLAASFRDISDVDDLVLCSDHHHQWVASLSGRRVLLGYRGWLMSYGIDYRDVERDVSLMLAGGPTATELMEHYGVDFVVIGEQERKEWGADEAYFAEQHERVLEGAGYRVYRRVPEVPVAGDRADRAAPTSSAEKEKGTARD